MVKGCSIESLHTVTSTYWASSLKIYTLTIFLIFLSRKASVLLVVVHDIDLATIFSE